MDIERFQKQLNFILEIDKEKEIYYTDYNTWCDIEISEEEMNVYILIKE